ncbi:MAG: TraX family protein [Candidatus Bathyarchaeia archaeon]
MQSVRMASSFTHGRDLLKSTALITMTIDHIGVTLYPEISVLRFIGRLSFPLFSYLLVLGSNSTGNSRRYFARLLTFAFVSQVPFYLAFGLQPFESLNVFFTLSSGLIFIYCFKTKNLPLGLLPLLASAVFNFDYGVYGIMSIGCMQLLMKDAKLGVASLLVLNLAFFPIWPHQFFSLLALPIILLHKRVNMVSVDKPLNEKIGYPRWRKYLFYFYYPIHLTILYYARVTF